MTMKRTLALFALGGTLLFSACAKEEANENTNDLAEGTEQTTPEEQATESARPEVVGGIQVITVKVTDMKYEPANIALTAGMPAKIVFDQHGTTACAWDVMSEDLGIELTGIPEGEKTPVEFTPEKAGTYKFSCGMDMLRGTIIVEDDGTTGEGTQL